MRRYLVLSFVSLFFCINSWAFHLECEGSSLAYSKISFKFPQVKEDLFLGCTEVRSQRNVFLQLRSNGTGIKNHLREVKATLRCTGGYRQARTLYGLKGSISCFHGIGCGLYFGRSNACLLLFHELRSFGFSGSISELRFYNDYGEELFLL